MKKGSGKFIRWFNDLDSGDVSIVGGKNASLGEMLQTLNQQGIRVPDGFATTAKAYREFLKENKLESPIRKKIQAWETGDISLQEAGNAIRRLFRSADFPDPIAKAIMQAYQELSKKYESTEVDVAVRSSATAEDLPEASFAGQQETFLNITGPDELLEACLKCYASLFTDRAISYRKDQSFGQLDVALSIGVQKMVRSDKASSGVMFTIDTETGFPDVVVINGAWGLGENVVQGAVTPDEFRVFKPLLDKEDFVPIIEKNLGAKEKKMVYSSGGSEATKNVDTSTRERRSYVLSDDEVLQLSRWAVDIEAHYDRPMDIEWAKDGESGELYIVQARPETVQSQKEAGSLQTYTLKEKANAWSAGWLLVARSPAEKCWLSKALRRWIASKRMPSWSQV